MQGSVEYDVLQFIKKYIILFAVTALLFGVAAYFLSRQLPVEYTTSTSMYFLSDGFQDDEKTASMDELDYESAKLGYAAFISGDLKAIMNSARAKKKAAELLGEQDLSGYVITIENSSTSRMVTLTVKGNDPQKCADIANAMAQATNDLAVEIMNVEALNVVESAVPSTEPSGPDRRAIILISASAGWFLSAAVVVFRSLKDTYVRSGDDVSEITGAPVVGHFSHVE